MMIKEIVAFLLVGLVDSDDKYKTIYDRDDPPGTYPDQRHVSLKDNSKTKGPLLKCGSNKISVIFDEAELAGSSLKARNPTEIFFRNHENCHSQKQDDKYVMTLFFPFTGCGTNVMHDTEDYVYTNEIVFKTRDNVLVTLLQFRCVYEDKYIVSYEHGLKPIERTIQFHTGMGKFDVDMAMYDGPNYSPHEKLQDRGGVYLNDRIYIQLEMYDPLQRNEIVLSVQTCYATDSPEFSQMNIFHYLISSMCAHPSDQTVQIHTNGISDKVRFSFNMFRFTESFSYIYLHCEVRICNTTSEICEGEGQICTGIDRGKRSLDYSSDFNNSSDSINGAILPFMSDLGRDKRSPGDYIPLHEDTQQFISRGPILAYIKDDTGQGEFTVNSIFLDIEEVNPFGIPKLFIFGTVASGLVFGVVVGLTLIICKHKKQADAREAEFNTYDQIQPVRTIYGDLMFSCKPSTGRTLPRCIPSHFL